MNLIRTFIATLSAVILSVIVGGVANSAEIPNMPTNGSALVGKIWSTKIKKICCTLGNDRGIRTSQICVAW